MVRPRFRITLLDVVLYAVLLIACFSAGVICKTSEELKRLASSCHPSQPYDLTLPGTGDQ